MAGVRAIIVSIDFAKQDDDPRALLEATGTSSSSTRPQVLARLDGRQGVEDAALPARRAAVAQGRPAPPADRDAAQGTTTSSRTSSASSQDQFIDLGETARSSRSGATRGSLRRMKEDLRGLRGHGSSQSASRVTVAFKLTQEYELYEEVTDYINEFLPRVAGKQNGQCRARAHRLPASWRSPASPPLAREAQRSRHAPEELEASRAERAKKPRFACSRGGRSTEQDEDDETEEEQALRFDARRRDDRERLERRSRSSRARAAQDTPAARRRSSRR